MPAKLAIFAPSIVMALMTLTTLVALGARRFIAVRTRAVNVKYYATFDEDGDAAGEPESLRRHTRHVQNHFEVPPLFHAAILGTYLVGEVGAVTLGLAWFFVASRVVHAVIHLGYNKVTHRFPVFVSGVLALFVLWARLLWVIAF